MKGLRPLSAHLIGLLPRQKVALFMKGLRLIAGEQAGILTRSESSPVYEGIEA